MCRGRIVATLDTYRCSCGVTYGPSRRGDTAIAIKGLQGFRTLELQEDGMFHCSDELGWHEELWKWPWLPLSAEGRSR